MTSKSITDTADYNVTTKSPKVHERIRVT